MKTCLFSFFWYLRITQTKTLLQIYIFRTTSTRMRVRRRRYDDEIEMLFIFRNIYDKQKIGKIFYGLAKIKIVFHCNVFARFNRTHNNRSITKW